MATKRDAPEETVKTTETQEEVTFPYAFPEHGLTVQATSLEEATKKVKALLSSKA